MVGDSNCWDRRFSAVVMFNKSPKKGSREESSRVKSSPVESIKSRCKFQGHEAFAPGGKRDLSLVNPSYDLADHHNHEAVDYLSSEA